MSAWRNLMGALVVAAVCTTASAATRLNPSHPDAYTVREGDTLWDISGKFLRDPWRWREVWQGNPQIRDPDLIYPGDVIYLAYQDGKPVLRLSAQGRPVVKLSPRIRSTPIESGAIPAIPIDAIRQFLSRPMVVEQNELEDAPYIISFGQERLVGSAGGTIYVRDPDGAETRDPLYTVLREGKPYVDPDEPDGEILGYEAVHIADATLERQGDPSKMRLVRTRREVLIGDRMIPAAEDAMQQNFMPHAPEDDVTGKIISVVEGVTQIGRHQVVVLSVGADQGVDAGSVLAVYRKGDTIDDARAKDPNAVLPEPDAEIEFDPDRQRGLEGFTMMLDRLARDIHEVVQVKDNSYRSVTLPVERSGTVMVFRVFDRVSYALVMDASAPLHVADWVRTPPN